jgi:pyrroloquinoline quinone biosynthesis protein B
VLGIAQDAGYPQVGCQGECCRRAWADPQRRRHATSLALVDGATKQRWLLECTPAITDQLHRLNELAPADADRLGLDGILLTHAHIGHYAGLMYIGREAVGAQGQPVYVMPRMQEFLTTSGPWRQLVTLGNVDLRPMKENQRLKLSDNLSITPFLVPHRDEFSETVGFLIEGSGKKVLFIPDIDKWDRWDRNLEVEIARVDMALIDATFFDGNELPGRDMSEIPHPFVVETMKRLDGLKADEKAKVHFIHLNHTNPLLDRNSDAYRKVVDSGFHVAEEGECYSFR